MGVPDVSVVIPTLNREEEIEQCVTSLTRLHTDWIILRQRGPLAALRNEGLRHARAPVVLFCDDDVVASPGYMRRMLEQMERPRVVGITGPSIIPFGYLQCRELFRHGFLLGWYNQCFVQPEIRPGTLTAAGTFVPQPDYTYQGSVQFLEACHMSFKTDALQAIGGFDETYGGVGDWSEPDLCFRLRERFGTDSLYFDPRLAVEHRCSPRGATRIRHQDAAQRLRNYERFARRWVTPHWRHTCYRGFLKVYYGGHVLRNLMEIKWPR
jgi:GT2 family glycosyltransferase